MQIKEITNQTGNDFWAVFECEFCGACITRGGYDDYYFNDVVIPAMVCEKCGKSTDNDANDE